MNILFVSIFQVMTQLFAIIEMVPVFLLTNVPVPVVGLVTIVKFQFAIHSWVTLPLFVVKEVVVSLLIIVFVRTIITAINAKELPVMVLQIMNQVLALVTALVWITILVIVQMVMDQIISVNIHSVTDIWQTIQEFVIIQEVYV